MKKVLFLIICFSIASVTRAQHTVSGIITDKSDNTHLVDGVLIYIPEFNRTDISKEGGTYILRNVGIGIVHLQFTKRGFKSILQTISTADSATVVNVEMEPGVNIPEEMTAASKSTRFSENSPVNDEVFPASELRRVGTINFSSALNYQPGIDNISLGNLNKIVIRGLSNNHVLMYQSGTRIENNSWNELQGDGMVEEGTELVDIIKGPASLMYGGNAMGGVMIFRDEKMPLAGTTEGDVNLGLFNNTLGINADVGIKGSSYNGIFYSMRFAEKSHTSYIQGEGDSAIKNTEEKDFAFNSGLLSEVAKGTFGISKKWGQSKLTFSYRNNENELIESLTDSVKAVIDVSLERDRKSKSPYINQETYLVSSENIFLVKKSQADVNLSWQSNDRKDFATNNNPEGVYLNQEMKVSTFSYEAKYSSDPLKKFGYTVGTQGYAQDEKNSYILVQSEDNTIISGGVYLLGRYDFQKINFLGGLRYDSRNVKSDFNAYDKVYGTTSGSAGLAWHPEKNLTIKANVSSGYSIPSLEQRSGYFYTYSKIVTGNPDLTQERNYEGDLGARLNTSDVTLSLNGYYNMINNYFYPDRTYEDNITHFDIYQYQQADANIKGGEFSLDAHPHQIKWVDLGVAYSVIRGDFKTGGNHLPGMPADKLVASLRFQSEQMNYLYHPFVSVVMSAYVNQDRVFSYETPTNSYSLFDLHLGGSFKTGHQMFDITISVKNILDQNYYSHLSLVKNAYPFPVREMGRNISLQVHIPFGIRQGK